MPRYFRRRYSRAVRPKKKYSWEHCNFVGANTAVAANGAFAGVALMVTQAGIGGMRKTKNFSLTLNMQYVDIPLIFALVYVPEGTQPSQLQLGGTLSSENPNFPHLTTASVYEPNQNVIMSGIVPASSTTPVIKTTRMARNLNSGDSIMLVFRTPNMAAGIPADTIRLIANLDYCISY